MLITIKDKDMVKDEVMGKLVLDPQKECLFEETENKLEQRYELLTEKSKLIIYCETSFKLKEVL